VHSALYEGWVRHRRFQPVANRFRYPLFMVFLDLEELPNVFRDHPFWSVGRPNVAYLRRADHFGDPAVPIAQATRDLVAAETGKRPDGPIRLLTHLRYFGHCFNPVSFHYCYDAGGRRVETIVAEITNTPWGERRCYVCDESMDEASSPRWRRFRLAKDFHVSPFMGMGIDYDWRFLTPGERLQVHMESWESGLKVFDATMGLRRRPICRAELTRALLRYPAMTLKVIAAIHFQALRLWWKRAPFYVHPSKRQQAKEGQP